MSPVIDYFAYHLDAQALERVLELLQKKLQANQSPRMIWMRLRDCRTGLVLPVELNSLLKMEGVGFGRRSRSCPAHLPCFMARSSSGPRTTRRLRSRLISMKDCL
jgi:hypothetical protein